jgi:p-cumate 2,3-dioxygenase beta subunit
MTAITRVEAEDFLYKEAYLLDRWELESWLGFFLPESRYLIPSTDIPNEDPARSLFLVDDDYRQLQYRVQRMFNRNAHSENPKSQTRRLLSNVMVLDDNPEQARIFAAFIVYRVRHEVMDVYVGHYENLMMRKNGQLRFLERKAVLDMHGLRPSGVISFIL